MDNHRKYFVPFLCLATFFGFSFPSLGAPTWKKVSVSAGGGSSSSTSAKVAVCLTHVKSSKVIGSELLSGLPDSVEVKYIIAGGGGDTSSCYNSTSYDAAGGGGGYGSGGGSSSSGGSNGANAGGIGSNSHATVDPPIIPNGVGTSGSNGGNGGIVILYYQAPICLL